MSIRQLTIIGNGLIGGSFAMALKQRGFSGRIVGCDRDPVLARAAELGAIDQAVSDPVHASQEGDVVVLATPVSAIIDLIERVGPVMRSDALLTDVGSTKRAISARAKSVFGASAKERFLPGHPITGKESGSIDSADATLFEGSKWVFCEQPSSLGQEFAELVRIVGATPVQMSSEEHDILLAHTSHLPQMLATALAAELNDRIPPEHASNASGRAVKEMTRLADSPYEVWRDIALTNADQIERALLNLEQKLAHIRENLRTRELREEFERAARFRASLREPNSGQ
jgi:prephenate dehydrogenase